MRNVLAAVPKANAEMVAALIRTIFAQPDAAAVREQLGTVADMLGRQFPQVQAMLDAATEELLAFTAFPVGHWKKISRVSQFSWRRAGPWGAGTRR